MNITPYNKNEAIEMLRARILLYMMHELKGPIPSDGHGGALWDIAGGMSEHDAELAIRAFEATQ
jgi:hypothetical protein